MVGNMNGSERSDCTEIKKKQFLGDRTLRSYVIPAGVREIGDWAFSGCKELSRIEVPATLERIGRDAFLGCDKLEEVRISNMEQAAAGLLALAFRFFPEAAEILRALLSGDENWVRYWDIACERYLSLPETEGFRPFWAGGEEDYEEDESKLVEHCRGKRLIKAEMAVKRLLAMDGKGAAIAEMVSNGEGETRCETRQIYEAHLRENDMSLEYLKTVKQQPALAVRIYEQAGALTDEKIRKVLEELPEEAVELRAALLKSLQGGGTEGLKLEEWML